MVRSAFYNDKKTLMILGTITESSGIGFREAVHPTISPPPTYLEFYKLLAKALRGAGEVPVNPNEARDVIRLVELVRESHKVGRTLKAEL